MIRSTIRFRFEWGILFELREDASFDSPSLRPSGNTARVVYETLAIGRDLLGEFYQVSFRNKVYQLLEDLKADSDEWVRQYNEERPHSGKYCYGKTPMQTFVDSIHVAKEN